jgi:MSHA biogenesis protein MshQ
MCKFKYFTAFFMLIFCAFSAPSLAAECQAIFPDVISSHGASASTSSVDFGYNARLINNPDTVLSTFQISHNLGSNINSCSGANCTASGQASAAISATFLRGNGTVNYSPPSNQTTTFGTTSINYYDQITANSNAVLNFSANHDVYFFEKLALGFNNTLNLAAGKTYYFGQFSVASSVEINVVGEGTAVVYIDSGVRFTAATMVNSSGENISGDVSKLVMHINGDVAFNNAVTYSGALYAKDVTFISASYLFGAASGENVAINSDSVLTYDNDIFDANLDDLCAKSAIANFKFDESEYADVAGEVKDSIGNFSGRATLAQTVEGKVCQALDLSATGTKDYVVLDSNVLDNENEFSISLWVKTAKTGTQSILSGATSGSHNELLMWFTRDTTFRPYMHDSPATSLTISSIAGDTWKHLVWTHGDNKSCLFIDKVAQGCKSQSTTSYIFGFCRSTY